MRLFRNVGFSLMGCFILIWSLGPLYWALVISLTSTSEMESGGFSFFPKGFTFENFAKLLGGDNQLSTDFYQALLNSVIQASGATIILVVVATTAGYALTRWRTLGLRVLFALIIGTIGVPLMAVLLPLFKFASDWGLMDTHLPIILFGVMTVLAISVWIVRSFVASIPVDLESAARIDGAGVIRIMLQVLFPLLRPAISAIAVICFLTTWGLFLPPLLFSQSMATKPLTVLIPTFVTKSSIDLGLQAAAGILAIAVPLILVSVLHRYLLGGLMSGAVK